MIRIGTLFGCLFTTLCISAQWSGGPLTIIASPVAGHPRPAPEGARGGAPYNDECQNAVIATLPPDGSVTVTGDNTGSTDTEIFGNPNCWEAFTIDTCSTVTVSYCGTEPMFGVVYSILLVGCPDPWANVQQSDTSACGDGNVIIVYESLAAGTYYVPVLLSPGLAEGPYSITLTSDVCDLPPDNDVCSMATQLSVVQDCAQGTVAGNNGNTVINSAPQCATTNTQFQDVWYQFDSGTNTEVLITLDPGSIGDMGVEVREACGGSSIFCATGDTSYVVPVNPGQNYRVRVFSNNDFGFGGTFSICVSEPPPPCDGGMVSILGVGTIAIACSNGGDVLEFVQVSTGTESLALVLTNAQDTIIGLLPGGSLDPNGMVPGEYHVWGLSYNGDLVNIDPGGALADVGSTGNCVELSDNYATVLVEICQGVQEQQASGWEATVITTPAGPLLHWWGVEAPITVEFFSTHGLLVARQDRTVQPGEEFLVSPHARPAPGLYLVRILPAEGMVTGGAETVLKRVVVP